MDWQPPTVRLSSPCSKTADMEKTLLLSDSDKDICYAAELIKRGEVVGIPTETVYGLGADALMPEAIRKIFAVKGRPADNPLIVHICSLETVKSLAHDVPELFHTLAGKFWPGPLTMIVPKNDCVPTETSGGLDTVGIRMPSHPIMRRLIALSGPIAAPSANISGYPSPTEAGHVMHDLNGKIPAIIDGGACQYGVESTVICFDDESTVRILRPGSTTKEMLEKVAPKVLLDNAVIHDIQSGEKAASPGMKYKHYSPRANVLIVKGKIEDFCAYIGAHSSDKTFCLIPDSEIVYDIPCRYMTYGDNSIQQAHNLFARLRELDEIDAETIFVRPPCISDEGLAVYNRLLRAAGFEVIKL